MCEQLSTRHCSFEGQIQMHFFVHMGILTRKMPLMTMGLRELDDASEGCKVEEERDVPLGRYPDDLYRTGTEEDER